MRSIWKEAKTEGVLHPFDLYRRLKHKGLINWSFPKWYQTTWKQYSQNASMPSLHEYTIWLNDWNR